MSIKEITIKNYKCFSKEKTIEFSVPDGASKGTGLNIFVGENNAGKTAAISTFTKFRKEAVIDREEKYLGLDVELLFKDDQGNEQVIKNIVGGAQIDSEVLNKEFSIAFENIHFIKDNRIWNSSFDRAITIESYKVNSNFKRYELDTQLARGLSNLEKDLPAKKKEFDDILKDIIPSFSNWTIDSSAKSGTFISYKMLSGESQDIDFSIGSGILNLFRILYALVVDEKSKIILIDEPEAFLHPIAQLKLSKVLAERAKDKQIIIATHSPYMFKLVLDNASLVIFKRDGDEIFINSLKRGIGLFQNLSPTFCEISYYAYGLITNEFHNELYGFVQSKYNLDTIKNTDTFLINEGDLQKPWIHNGGIRYEGLSSYIRNYIHHPEQDENPASFTDDELKTSIEFLIELMEKP